MAGPESEDAELDFTDFMEKQKSDLKATTAENVEEEEYKKPMPPSLVRGVVFFGILLILLGVLIIVYINRPNLESGTVPEGFRIIEVPGGPPKLQRNQ